MLSLSSSSSSLLLLLLLLPAVVVVEVFVDGLSQLSPNLMDPIVNHPSISKLGIEDRPRSKLKSRHMKYFQQQQQHSSSTKSTSSERKHYTKLLNELGLMACETGVVPRKELLETFAAAVYIHEKFSSNINRYADIAAGHGLLSWFLLVLSESEEDNDKNSNSNTTKTAICIDRRMPQSAEIIATKMIEKYPHLKSKWCYVETDLQSIETHPTTLLVSVHACGSLSDKIIEMAITGNAPLAVVPCCHTIKVKKGYQPHPLIKMDVTDVETLVAKELIMNDDHHHTTLGDVVDQIRHNTLLKAGYNVEECMIPELFTKRNRLILGEKKEISLPETIKQQQQQQHQYATTTKQPSSSSSSSSSVVVVVNNNQMPKIEINKINKIKLPLADDPTSREKCELASGRKQSSARLIASVPRHFNPTYDVSIWLPNNTVPLSSKLYIALQVLANDCCTTIQQQQQQKECDNDEEEEEEKKMNNSLVEEEEKMFCIISTINEPHTDKSTGKISQTYRFQYSNKLSLGESEINTSKSPQIPIPIDKKIAKAIHSQVCSRLPNELGLIVR